MFTEEKREKKEVQERLDNLQEKYTQKIEDFGYERIKMTRKQYIFFGCALVFA